MAAPNRAPRRAPKREQKKSPLRRPLAKAPVKAAPRADAPHRARPDVPSQKLQKVLAQAGLGSRRTMEQWIGEGQITVNGKVAGIGARVTPVDVIKVGQRVIRWGTTKQLAPRLLLYHKPEGEIVTMDDPAGRPTVYQKLPPVRGAKWVAIGRLDYNTGGLLIFTTAGELANRMMHPRFEVEREYAVRLLGQLTPVQIRQLTEGLELVDGMAHFESVEEEGGEGTNRWYRIVLREGRNRVVRRMFEKLGMTVSRLMRVRFGIISLPPRLKRGQVVELPADEVKRVVAWLKETAPALPPADPPG